MVRNRSEGSFSSAGALGEGGENGSSGAAGGTTPGSNGVILATAGYDHTIRFWDASTGHNYRSLQHRLASERARDHA